MPTDRWLSSLANIETRLRRSLGLAGPVGTRIEQPAIVQPVILADDATRPGAVVGAGIRGRRFSICREQQDLNDTITSFSIYTDSPYGVILEKAFVSWSSGNQHNHFYAQMIPTLALQDGALVWTRGARWREAPLGINDVAPMFEAAGTSFPAGGTWPVFNATKGPGQATTDLWDGITSYLEIPLDVFLDVNQGMQFYFGEDDFTGEWFITVYGRVF